MQEQRKVIVPFPDLVRPLARVRSTVLLSSQGALRSADLYPSYLSRIATHRDALISMVAATWISLDVAEAHYEACARLHLPDAKVMSLGRAFASAPHNVFVAGLLRVVREAGGTPWMALEQSYRMWGHGFDGSAISVERLGPKDVRIRIAAIPLAQNSYFRLATCGFAGGLVELSGVTAFSKVVPSECSPSTLSYHVAWA